MIFPRENRKRQRAREKRTLYLQGLMDAKRQRPWRWASHPHINEYRRGFYHGMKWYPRAAPPIRPARKRAQVTLLSVLERWIGRRPGK